MTDKSIVPEVTPAGSVIIPDKGAKSVPLLADPLTVYAIVVGLSEGLLKLTVNWASSLLGSLAIGSLATIETRAASSSTIVPMAVSVVLPTSPETTLATERSNVSVISKVMSSVVKVRTSTPEEPAGIVTSLPPVAAIQVVPPSVENSNEEAKSAAPLVVLSAAAKSSTISVLDGLDSVTSKTNWSPSIALASSIVTSGAGSSSRIVPRPMT